jgi:hypothetical protein
VDPFYTATKPRSRGASWSIFAPALRGIEAQHPDEFIFNLFDLAPGLVIEAAENHRSSLKNPPKTVDEYLAMLESQGLTQTTSFLREYIRGLK